MVNEKFCGVQQEKRVVEGSGKRLNSFEILRAVLGG